MASYRDINYALRPAKNIERKMLSETFQRLAFIGDLKNYRYIGLGSTYFSDFELFHKDLNISKLISIEADEGNSSRFKFNRPYACVDLRFGHTSDVLPTLDYEQRDIIWLDYDGELEKYILDDIDTIVSNVQMGSIFLISMNVSTPQLHLCDEEKTDPIRRKEKTRQSLLKINEKLFNTLNLDKEMDPKEYVSSVHKGWNFSKRCRGIINEGIHKSIKNREDREREGIKYKQLFNFHYADGAKMLTVGGIIYNEELAEKVNFCNFDDLSYISGTEEAIEIEVPNLTYKEIKYLKKYMSSTQRGRLPKDMTGKRLDHIIPEKEIRQFQKIYRYFPTFSEVGF